MSQEEKKKTPLPQNEADQQPLQIRHGRQLLRGVVETKSSADLILSILNSAGEESVVLDTLQRIEAKQDLILDLLLPPDSGSRRP